jgi:hypothetical protein
MQLIQLRNINVSALSNSEFYISIESSLLSERGLRGVIRDY